MAVLEMNSIQSYKMALFQMMFVYVQQLEPSCYRGQSQSQLNLRKRGLS